jgi:flagellar biosynthesis protein FliR
MAAPLTLQMLLGADAGRLLLAGGAALARVTPAVWLAPFLGGKLVPATVKMGVSLALALTVAPSLAPSVRALEGSGPLLLLGLLLKELAVGAAAGFVVGLVFQAAEAGGRLMDTARGANLAEALVPQLGERSSPLGDLSFQLTLVLFLALGGHRLFLMALGTSYQLLPLGAVPHASGLAGLAGLCLRLTADLLALAVSLAAPALAAGLIADLVLGAINRFVPQAQVFFLGMPLKAAAGLLLLAGSAGLLVAALPGALEAAVAAAQRALELLAR